MSTPAIEWSRLAQQHLAWLSAGGASKGSLRLRRHYLTMLSNVVECGPEGDTEQHLADFLTSRRWAVGDGGRRSQVNRCRPPRRAGAATP
jgi:hypothetical protein